MYDIWTEACNFDDVPHMRDSLAEAKRLARKLAKRYGSAWVVREGFKPNSNPLAFYTDA